MKTILSTILIGLTTGVVGWVIVTFLVEVLFTASSKEVASIFGWGIYLCCVIVVCTGIIISKTKK